MLGNEIWLEGTREKSTGCDRIYKVLDGPDLLSCFGGLDLNTGSCFLDDLSCTEVGPAVEITEMHLVLFGRRWNLWKHMRIISSHFRPENHVLPLDSALFRFFFFFTFLFFFFWGINLILSQ